MRTQKTKMMTSSDALPIRQVVMTVDELLAPKVEQDRR